MGTIGIMERRKYLKISPEVRGSTACGEGVCHYGLSADNFTRHTIYRPLRPLGTSPNFGEDFGILPSLVIFNRKLK